MGEIKELFIKYTTNTLGESDCTDNERLLVEMYMNDKNSSTPRQLVMCEMAGVETNPNKLGFDGLNSVIEMKPKNILSNGESKLSLQGNYSDMTLPRHNKFIEQNALIHAGGFIDGKLIFQLEVPYADLADHFKKQLDKFFPNGHESGRYLRSMNYSLTQIKQTTPRVIFITPMLESYRGLITKNLYNYLIELSGDE